jgi:hypothetical protein
MAIPGFTAEAALYPTQNLYRTEGLGGPEPAKGVTANVLQSSLRRRTGSQPGSPDMRDQNQRIQEERRSLRMRRQAQTSANEEQKPWTIASCEYKCNKASALCQMDCEITSADDLRCFCECGNRWADCQLYCGNIYGYDNCWDW